MNPWIFQPEFLSQKDIVYGSSKASLKDNKDNFHASNNLILVFFNSLRKLKYIKAKLCFDIFHH